MYKMKFINNKWNPTFSRNIQSSCSFRLSESCVLVNKVRLIQGLGERCLWAWKSMSSMLWASTIFFPLTTLPFLSTAACLDLNIFSLSPPFIPSCSEYLYHMGEQREQQSLKTQSISCSGCYILYLPEKEHCHSCHSLHLIFHPNEKQDLNSQSWWEENVRIYENSLHVLQEKSFPGETPSCCSLSWKAKPAFF